VASLAPAYVPRKPTETVLHQLVRANLGSETPQDRALRQSFVKAMLIGRKVLGVAVFSAL
jgi:hypothetical protein